MLSIPDRFNQELPNLVSTLKIKHQEIIPVHRLDRYTSGINVYAKNVDAHKLLSLAFENRDIEKYYKAIVDGIPNPESGRIDIPIAESTVTRGKMLIHQRGKESITDYKIIQNFKKFSLLYIRIHTGRMHQIRVHLQYLGNPLIVDNLYGHRDAFYLSEIKTKKFNIGKYAEERPLLTRQPLHAEKLVFTHPIFGKKIELFAEMPKDMDAVLRQMDKWIK
jgi:RluA family pseudouridine synthase